VPAYTIHVDQTDPDSDRAMVQMTLVPEKFSLWAFAFGPFWLIYHSLWVALSGWIFIVVALVGTGIVLKIPAVVILTIIYTIDFLLGLEGNTLRRWRLHKRGYAIVDIAAGRNAEEAERRFLTRQELNQLVAVRPGASTAGFPGWRPEVPEQVGGLFDSGGPA
jgi:hypothetical protein